MPDDKTPPVATEPGMKFKDVRQQASKGTLFTHIDADKTATFKIGEGAAATEHTMTHKQLMDKIAELGNKISGKTADGKEAATKLTGETLKQAESELKVYKEKAGELLKGVSESRYKEFGKLSFTQKIGAKLAGNFGEKTSTLGKFGRGATTGLGVVLVGKGFMDLVSPNRDDKGENTTGLVVPILEVGAGGALAYFAALHGGANKAMGLGKI